MKFVLNPKWDHLEEGPDYPEMKPGIEYEGQILYMTYQDRVLLHRKVAEIEVVIHIKELDKWKIYPLDWFLPGGSNDKKIS